MLLWQKLQRDARKRFHCRMLSSLSCCLRGEFLRCIVSVMYLLIPCRLRTGNAGMPSKVWSIMACNTPIIASFDIDSDLADVLISSGAGRCVQPGSAEALAEAIKDAYMVYSAGNKSSADIRKYVIQNASKDVCVKKYVETMIYVVEHRGERCL